MAYRNARGGRGLPAPDDDAADLAERLATRDGTAWNVLMISVDELAFDAMGWMGHPVVRTPNIDQLAADSVRMLRSYATHPLCAPARHSWVTGLWAPETGMNTNGRVWNDAHPNLVDVFSAAGFTTQNYGKLHTSTSTEDAAAALLGYDQAITEKNVTELPTYQTTKKQAYDALHNPSPPVPSWDADDEAAKDRIAALTSKTMFATQRFNPFKCADRVLLEYGLDWLDANGTAGQFFLHIGFRFPHYPWDCTATFNDGAGEDFYFGYGPDDVPDDYYIDPSPTENNWDKAASAWGGTGATDADQRRMTARYWSAITQVDDYIGQLLAKLEALGLTDETLVVLVSDHGEMGGHRQLWLKSNFYEQSARTVCLFKMPGVLRAHDNLSLFSGADLLLTAAGLVGIPESDNALGDVRAASGSDWSDSLIRSEACPRDHLVAYSYVTAAIEPSAFMATDGRFKLTEYANTTLVNWDTSHQGQARWELYDLEMDPDELTNLNGTAGYTAKVAELSAAIADHSAYLRTPLYDTTPP